jgi:hypothetical protein
MVTVPRQFSGPEHSANGGYVGGMLAEQLGGDCVTVTLRQPPPLDTPLTWERDEQEVRLVTAGGAVVAEATHGAFARDAAPCPPLPEAEAATARFQGYQVHPYSRCFTCGTDRLEGDGFRLFAGPTGDGRTATPWTPHPAFGDLDVPLTWAALDCPGAWTIDLSERTLLLGRMTAEVLRPARAQEPLLSTARYDGEDGRKIYASTALYTRGGELLGRAEQTWISVTA